MKRRSLRTSLSVALTAILLAPGAVARADESAAAEALFLEGKALMDKQQFANACPKFEASAKLDRTLGTLMNLADCEQKIGHTASAWAHWGEAAELAKKDGDKRLDFAASHRDELTPRLPRLKVDAKARAGIEVFRDATKIDPGAYGTALPTDPGPHVVTVRRGEEVLRKESVTTAEGATVTLPLDLEAIESLAPRPRVVTGPAAGSGQRTAGYVIGGIGIATVIVAGVLEIVAIRAKSDADQPDSCVKGFCTPAGLDTLDRARTFATVGQWVGIGGLVVTAVGVTTLLTAPSSKSAPAAAAPVGLGVSPWLGPTGGGLSLHGAL